MTSSSTQPLGEFTLSLPKFSSVQQVIIPFKTPAFLAMHVYQRQDRINRTLYELISETPMPCFLLAAVVDYMQHIEELGVLDTYTLSHFELWLNQFSGLSFEENYQVRAKIVGKFVPRTAYQSLFPIGMGKIYPGSHFVTAHSSPDLDTTIASFWGWMDAFGARVSEGLHLWNLPGGAPESQVEVSLLFSQLLGNHVFTALSKTRTALSLSAMDLMTQKGLVKENGDKSILSLDHDGNKKAIVLVDSQGQYIGDWKSVDVESVRQVISFFNHCLRWFSQHVQVQLLSLFALKQVQKEQVARFVESVLSFPFNQSEPWKEFTEKQRTMINAYLVHILQIPQGSAVVFEQFVEAVHRLNIGNFQEFLRLIKGDVALEFLDNREKLFGYVQQVIEALNGALEEVRCFVERLDVAIRVKSEVFGRHPSTVGYRADVDEIKAKMIDQPYLSVSMADDQGQLVPLGVIHGAQLSKPILGTVTLRDFCNTEETKIPSYLEVISVIDHHKSQLHTTSAPMAIIADAQSSNVLCAEMAFQMNDRFGIGGMSADQMQRQVDQLMGNALPVMNKRLLSKLLYRQSAIQESGSFFVERQREILEYLQFLYGIFDDTDLLTKVSMRDVECVVQLINRLKSLFLQEEVEVLSLSDLPRDEHFVRQAARRILQNPDVYSLYRKVYLSKEKLVDQGIIAAAAGGKTEFFADTKEQNGCARVGQAKLFPSNYPMFAQHSASVQKRWLALAEDVFSHHGDIDLHLQMVSTVAGAQEVFAGSDNCYKHQDELWIWIPFTDASIEHLKEFLGAFSGVPLIRENPFSAELYGNRAGSYEGILRESFLPLVSKQVYVEHPLSFAVLKYPAGLLNSRKAMISPYLPRLVR